MPENDDASELLWGIGKWIIAAVGVGVAAWLLKELLLDVVPTERLIDNVKANLMGHRVLVLGPTGTGKTALLWYMEKGEPMLGGRGPDKTIGTIIVDVNHPINKNKLAQIKKDLSGEKTAAWAAVMEEVKPTGIIYMIDPTGGDRFQGPGSIEHYESVIKRELPGMFSNIFDVYGSKKLPLKVFHIFLNFADKWSADPAIVRRLVRYTEDVILAVKAKPAFANTKIQVSVTQLAPHTKKWPEVQNAIDHFGADLGYAV